MRGAIISIGFGVGLLGCAPDLAANAAARCTDSLECAADAVCYRGFCVPAEDVASDAGAPTLQIDDAAQASAPRTEHDAAITPAVEGSSSDAASAATDTSRPVDASGPQPGSSAPDPADMTSKPQTSTPTQPAAAGSAGAPEAGAPMQPAVPTQPTAPAQPATPDAGSIVVDLPGSCTLADCCAEARASLPGQANEGSEPAAKPKAEEPKPKAEESKPKAGEDDKSGPMEKRPKSCGCADPALLSGILCGLLDPLGVLP